MIRTVTRPISCNLIAICYVIKGSHLSEICSCLPPSVSTRREIMTSKGKQDLATDPRV